VFITPRISTNDLTFNISFIHLVFGQNALDLDQKAMEIELDTITIAGFDNARNIYKEGGHSKSYAVLSLTTALSSSVSEGTSITGSNNMGDVVTGEAYVEATSGSRELQFRYGISSNQVSYSGCQVGGLSETNTAGCKQNFNYAV
jgi:hypothetical protein